MKNIFLIKLLLNILVVINCQNYVKVRLIEIQTLTFSEGMYTTGRRTSPIPQLQCTGGNAGCSRVPSSVQCYNRGNNGVSVQWECKAQLVNGIKFGTLSVSCEGFDYSGDPYVLAGSCGLKYSLEYTHSGSLNVGGINGGIDGKIIGGIVIIVANIIGIVYCCVFCKGCQNSTPGQNYVYRTSGPGGTTIINNPTPYYSSSYGYDYDHHSSDYIGGYSGGYSGGGGGGGVTSESTGFASTEIR